MKAKLRHIILIFFFFTGVPLLAQNCDWASLDDAHKNYQLGDFQKLIKELPACIKEGFDGKQRVEAWRLLAKTYLALDNDSSASLAAVELLKINPKFQPDYLSDPPQFVQIIERIKKQGSAQIVTSVSKKAENINQAPATATLITEKQLQNRGYLDLEAVLHDLSGFDISRSNGNLYSHIYQRGYRSINTNRTLFLVDGIEENDLWSNNVYLSRQYAMSNIKNVEVIYGPASTMYGSNAFLGVVNVITKEPQDFFQAGKNIAVNAHLSYGSYNTKLIDATLALRTKDNNLAFSVTGRLFYSDEQDLSKYADYDFKPIELNDELAAQYHSSLDITSEEAVSGFLATYPSSGSLYFLNSNNEIVLTEGGVNQALSYDNDVYDKADFSDKTEAYSVDMKLKIYDFLIAWSRWSKAEGPGAQYNDLMFMGFNQGQSWRPVHNYFYVKYDKDINSKLNISNFLRYKIHDFDKDNSIVRYRKNYLNGRFDLEDLIAQKVPVWDSIYLFQKSSQLRNEFKVLYSPVNQLDIVAGFEMRFSSMQGDYTFSKHNDAEETGAPLTNVPGGNQFFSQDLGVYAQAGIGFIRNFNFTLGLRYDYNHIRENQGYGHTLNPRLAVVYMPGSFVFKAIYAEAFKDANNREKYSTAPGKRELPNPGLLPEKVSNVEFAIGKNLAKNMFANVVFYRSNYSNIIQEVQVLRDDGSYTNQNQATGSAEVNGVNAFFDWNWKSFSFNANYTFTLPYVLQPKDSEGNPLIDPNGNPYNKLRISDIADHQVNLVVNYLFRKKINLNMRMNWVGKRITGVDTTVPTNPETFNPYAVFHAAVSYTLPKWGFKLQFAVFNLFDTTYFSPGLDAASGVLASKLIQNGRNMHLSLHYRF